MEQGKKHLTRMQWLIIIGLLVLASVCGFAVVRTSKVYTSYEVTDTWSRGDNTSVYYHMMSRGMVRYSKDGAAMSNQSGSVVWNQTYEMASPIIASSANYFAIGDMGANDIYIFDQTGVISKVKTDVPIQNIEISEQGVVAAILSDADSNYIHLYDKSGKVLIDIKATLENTGYPLAIGLSSDASKLVVSYLRIDSGTVATELVFYGFDETSDNHVKYEETLTGLYPKIIFLNDNRVAAIGEKGFTLYSVGNTVGTFQTVAFEEEIQSIFEGDQKLGFIFKNSDENGKYRAELYDAAGKLGTTLYFDTDYQKVAADDEEIIIYNDEEILIYQYSGNLRFSGTTNIAVEQIMPAWENDMYWLVDEQNLREIRIQ